MPKQPDWLKILAASVGGWLSLMSGGLSIPFAFAALLVHGEYPKEFFAVLAYFALWGLVFGTARKNYQLMRPPPALELSEAAMELLLEAAKGSDIVYVDGFGGASINVGGREFIQPYGDTRTRAIYSSALHELEMAGCINVSGDFRRLTAKAYAIADSKARNSPSTPD